MSENFTLDEFGPWEDPEATPVDEPIEPVRRWRPDAADCPRCGTPVQERWEDGGISGVCLECKEW